MEGKGGEIGGGRKGEVLSTIHLTPDCPEMDSCLFSKVSHRLLRELIDLPEGVSNAFLTLQKRRSKIPMAREPALKDAFPCAFALSSPGVSLGHFASVLNWLFFADVTRCHCPSSVQMLPLTSKSIISA